MAMHSSIYFNVNPITGSSAIHLIRIKWRRRRREVQYRSNKEIVWRGKPGLHLPRHHMHLMGKIDDEIMCDHMQSSFLPSFLPVAFQLWKDWWACFTIRPLGDASHGITSFLFRRRVASHPTEMSSFVPWNEPERLRLLPPAAVHAHKSWIGCPGGPRFT